MFAKIRGRSVAVTEGIKEGSSMMASLHVWSGDNVLKKEKKNIDYEEKKSTKRISEKNTRKNAGKDTRKKPGKRQGSMQGGTQVRNAR